VTDRILGDYGSDELPDPPGYLAPDYSAQSGEELAASVEEKRQSLIPLRDRTVVLRLVTNHLAYWTFCEKKHTRLGRAKYVIKMVAEDIPAREVNPKVVLKLVTAELAHLGAIQEQVPGFLVDSSRSTRVCQGG
jgi:hypothetical protein